MSLIIEPTQRVPLTQDAEGVWRITGSRVTLDSIVHQFQSGATAEQMQEDFPSLALSDLYSVIAYYLQHRLAVDDYLNEQARTANEIQRELERDLATGELRERLRQRRAQARA